MLHVAVPVGHTQFAAAPAFAPGAVQVELVHTGAGNPTLVLRPNQQPQVLKQGELAHMQPVHMLSLSG
jgi:hypothetical protein